MANKVPTTPAMRPIRYVDFIGADVYDFWPALTSDSAWTGDCNSTYEGGPKGIGSWLNFAKSQGKKLTVSEWGVIKGSPYSGGDNPVFVEGSSAPMPARSATSRTST